jgi:hypothetical protein
MCPSRVKRRKKTGTSSVCVYCTVRHEVHRPNWVAETCAATSRQDGARRGGDRGRPPFRGRCRGRGWVRGRGDHRGGGRGPVRRRERRRQLCITESALSRSLCFMNVYFLNLKIGVFFLLIVAYNRI